MDDIGAIVAQVETVTNGFKPIRDLADQLASERAPAEVADLARRLLRSELRQARMLATLLLGRIAARDAEALNTLREEVSRDADWRVQEMLAMAFDHWCRDTGYERSLPTIEAWIADPNGNVRRAASEGLRVWTHRPYFREHPERAVALLARLRADDHEHVRRSAGNALRDISRVHRELVAAELAQWDLDDPRVAETHTLASRFLHR